MPTSLAGADDDGAPPTLPPGARVHVVGGNGEVTESSGTPSQEAVEAARARAIDPPLMIGPGEVSYAFSPAPRGPARAASDVAVALVAKFPDYDPNWPAKTQSAWFDGFARLMDIVKEG